MLSQLLATEPALEPGLERRHLCRSARHANQVDLLELETSFLYRSIEGGEDGLGDTLGIIFELRTANLLRNLDARAMELEAIGVFLGERPLVALDLLENIEARLVFDQTEELIHFPAVLSSK